MTGGASHGVPGTVKAVVPVDLPGERDANGVTFNELEREIARLVHGGDGAIRWQIRPIRCDLGNELRWKGDPPGSRAPSDRKAPP